MKQPNAEQIKAARIAAGLTQTQAAELIYKKLRQWANYESTGNIDPALWELFRLKVILRERQ